MILVAPVIINDTCQLPGFVVNLSPIVTTLKHLKKCNYVDKAVGPNASIALGGSIFLMRHLLAYGIDLVGPDCPPLHVQSSPDSSRLFSMFTTADSGVAVSAQRRRRRSDHLRKFLISNETTELA